MLDSGPRPVCALLVAVAFARINDAHFGIVNMGRQPVRRHQQLRFVIVPHDFALFAAMRGCQLEFARAAVL